MPISAASARTPVAPKKISEVLRLLPLSLEELESAGDAVGAAVVPGDC